MFKFLCAPFEGEYLRAIEEYTLSASSAIVWESRKGVRLITANIARTPERRYHINERMQVRLEKLNSGSLKVIKQTLRVIIQENTRKPSVRPNFGADFGRMDFLCPGQGGSGVDGYW